jgi:hypothetical protein
LFAQDTTPAVTPVEHQTVLLDGTPVKLKLSEDISSATAQSGNEITFELAEDIIEGDTVIVPRGNIAIGTIDKAKGKGFGHNGKLSISIQRLRVVEGRKIILVPLRASQVNAKGHRSVGATAFGSLIIPGYWWLSSKDTTIPRGTRFTAFVNGDTTVFHPL